MNKAQRIDSPERERERKKRIYNELILYDTIKFCANFQFKSLFILNSQYHFVF